MSGTSIEEDDQERADHEAGHFVMACLTRHPFVCNFVTIKKSTKGGGRCNIYFNTPPPSLESYYHYALGGVAAQFYGRAQRSGLPIDESERAAISARLSSGSNHDRNLVKGHPDFAEPFDLSHFKTTLEMIRSDWSVVQKLSKELAKRKTLFKGEAEFIVYNEPEKAKSILKKYRFRRKIVTPHEDWLDGESKEFPAGPYYESLEDFRARAKI